jgi:hypothetical protein
MCRPACRIIQTGVRSVRSPLAARINSGSFVGVAAADVAGVAADDETAASLATDCKTTTPCRDVEGGAEAAAGRCTKAETDGATVAVAVTTRLKTHPAEIFMMIVVLVVVESSLLVG